MRDAKSIVKQVGTLLDRVIPPPPGITILIYHRVGGGTDSDVDLNPELFDRQLQYLAEHHRVLTLDDAVAELTTEDAPEQPVASATAPRGLVITFDDGTADFTDVVAPALGRYGLPATLYLATQFIEESSDFPWGAPPASWAALRDSLTAANITIGSHTHAHRLLDRIDKTLVGDDLDRSIDLIGEHLNLTPRHFAYPKALPGSPASEIAVRRRFATAALGTSRVNRPGSTDLYRLWRTPIQQSDGFDTFTLKADGGLRFEGEMRAVAARARYRGAER